MEAKEENGRSKVNWNTFIAASGLLVTVLIALGGMAVYAIVSPLRADITGQAHAVDIALSGQTEIQKLQREVVELKIEKALAIEDQHFKEIDTQINWATDIENIHKRHVLQLLGILWQKTFGEELPLPPSLNDGPIKEIK